MPKPGLRPSIFVFLPLLLLASVCVAPAGARKPNLSRYPLRVHVLASDETHETPGMSPAESVACDSIEDMVSSISPDPGGPVSLSGVSSDPCSLHAGMVVGRMLDLPDQDPIYSGEGRGDLVSPPSTTQALTFQYDDCVRVRVRPGFESLPARWKKPGKKLEVLIPSDDIPVSGRPLPPVKCTLTATLHDFVYLRLRSGQLVEVSQELYQEKPAMRAFLSGNVPTVQQRLQEFTIPAHPAH
jgi:hypothetical protein